MALQEKMESTLNDQINAEMSSAYIYLAMGAWFEHQGLLGFANWFRCQFLEENMHGMKFYNFINERGGRVILKSIEAAPTEWESIKNAFEVVLKHEQYITERINKMVKIARSIDDYASESFLMWFVDEQVEEEAVAEELLNRLNFIGNDPNAIFNMDQEMAKRAPSANVIPTHLNQAGGA